MATADRVVCPDDPKTMQDKTLCLSRLSKNLEGGIGEPKVDERECKQLPNSLVTVQSLKLEIRTASGCDDENDLDGGLEIDEFVHVFRNDPDDRRGFHSAEFRWQSALNGTLIVGTLSGISNAETDRAVGSSGPCFSKGVDEGRFCGTIEETQQDDLSGAQVFGLYRLTYASPAPVVPPGGIPEQPVFGTLEGLLIRPGPQ